MGIENVDTLVKTFYLFPIRYLLGHMVIITVHAHLSQLEKARRI